MLNARAKPPLRQRLRAVCTGLAALPLARASVALLSLSALGRVAALGKEMLVAALFGVGGQLDAYVLALLIPSFLVNMLGASFSSALIPALGRLRATAGEAAARDVLSSALLALAAILGLAALLLLALPAPALRVLSPLALAGRLEEIKALQLALLPFCVLGGLANVLGALVNLQGDFKGPALASLANTAVLAGCAAALSGPLGIGSLALGMDAGFLLEVCVLLVLTRRAWGPVFRGWRGQGQEVLGLLRNGGAMALSAGLLGLTAFVDNALASMTCEGGVSALGYAAKLPSLVTTLGGATLATLLLPHFSETAHSLAPLEFWRRLKGLLLWLLAVVGPLALACALASRPLIELAFQRGGFTSQATDLVAAIQVFYLLQLPFYLVGVVASRVLQARGLHHLLLGLTAVALVLNAGLSYMFMSRFGAPGIALSSLCMYLFTAASTVLLARRACRG